MKSGGTKIHLGGMLATMKANSLSSRFGFTGNGSEWFGPGVPLPEMAPADVEGRQNQFPINQNALIQTKVDGLDFARLRMFADSVDIIRLLIETRKDQICAMEWSVQLKGIKNKDARQDKRCEELERFLEHPDQDHNFAEWLRLLLEDMFVLDAPCCYVQRNRGGGVYALRPVDGSTIKRIIDGHGWTPAPPDPAFQQILYGVPAVNYTTDELVYRPRNPRTNRIYGLGHVEQIIVTAQTWLQRQASTLAYYDEGSVPDGFISAPQDWGAQDIKDYQDMLDLQLSGQLGERRKLKVTPPGSKYTASKEPAFKSDYDEWLARIACYCFSISPMPFVKMMNRASSEQQQEQADTEGVEPLSRWVKGYIDFIIARHFGFADIEFVWADRESPDPMVRAQIDEIYLAAKVLTPNEVRADLGLDELPDPVENEPGDGAVLPPPVPALPAPAMKHDHGDLAKRADVPMTADMLKLQAGFERAFAVLRDAVIAALPMQKAEKPKKTVRNAEQFAEGVDLSGFKLVIDELHNTLEAVASDGSKTVIGQIVVQQPGIKIENPPAEWHLFGGQDPRATEWASKHAAELIGKNAKGGKLVQATRNMIRKTVADAMENDLTRSELAEQLRQAYAFSPARAELIARTEIRNAQGQGHLIGAKAAGQTKKRWLVSNTDEPCPLCTANAAQGFIDIDREFVSGVQAPLMHPNCRCSITFRRNTEE